MRRMRCAAFLAPLLSGCPPPNPATCGGFCGEGTKCVNARCVVAAEEAVEVTDEDHGNGKRNRKRRRGRRGGGGVDADGKPLPKFVPVDDSSVPRYDDNRGQTITNDSGTERLADRDVRKHMRNLEDRFNRCIATAADYADDLGTGQIAFDINVEPSGRVSGVSVQAPRNLRAFGIVPCMRVVVHRTRFPSWDGPAMRVEYSFQVG